MSSYNNLRSGIVSVIKTNGNNEITGQLLQNELLAMIATLGYGYQFMGIAFPGSYPGTPDAKIFYIAYQPGTYVNMGGIVVTGLCVLKYDTTWTKEDIPVSGGGGGTDFTVEPTDLTLMSGNPQKLKFADRLRESNIVTGLNYVIVRDGAGIAGQMNVQNAIYEIRYDFDLSSGTLNVPSGCYLRFNGGKIKNGTIAGSRTGIIAGDCEIFENIRFSGTFIGRLNAVWVGAKSGDSSFDNSAIIQAWFNYYANVFRELYFPVNTYYFRSTATLTSDKRNLTLNGGNSFFNVNISTDDAYFIKLQNSDTSGSSGEDFKLQDVKIKNVKQTGTYDISRTRCLLLDRAQRFAVINVDIWYFDIAVTLIDAWYGGFYGTVGLRKNRIGIEMDAGNHVEINTILMPNIDFRGVSRDAVAAIYPQQDGESDADYITRTASCGIDSYVHMQGVGVDGCVFEEFDYGIRGNFRMRASAASTTGGPLKIDNCYFEANRQKDIYFGIGNAAAKGSGSSYYRFLRNVAITNCRFYTLKEVYFYGILGFISGNQAFDLYIESASQSTTVVDYSGPVTIKSMGGNASAHRIGPRSEQLRANNGNLSNPSQGFQQLQQTRSIGVMTSRQNEYSRTSSSPYASIVQYRDCNFNTEPEVKSRLDIMPVQFFNDPDNSYNRILVPSGNALVPVQCSETYNFRAINAYGSISMFEFVRRWKAGTVYTGTVRNLFPFIITADPTAGTVVNESGTIVGFGINALGTTITTSSTGYYLFVDALIWVRVSYSKIKQYADAMQCGRLYSELRGSIDGSSGTTNYLACYGTNANLSLVQKRLNAVYYDSDNAKLMIYNGFEWVEMTSAFRRFYYQEFGLKLAERATMPDLPGQTFINYATGIKYTFTFRENNNYKWVPSIGMVDSLTHPNGYSSDSTLDYANELSVGEMVMYNGALYKWDGTQLVAV